MSTPVLFDLPGPKARARIRIGTVVGALAPEVVAALGAFHGRTMGSLSATPNPKYQTPFSPMVPGFKYGTYNDIEGINSLVT